MADAAKCRANIFRHVSNMSSDTSMPHRNCRRQHSTNPTKFLARPAKIRLRLPTKQSIHLLYGDLTKLMYFAIPVKLEGSILPESGDSIKMLPFFLRTWLVLDSWLYHYVSDKANYLAKVCPWVRAPGLSTFLLPLPTVNL